MDASRNPFCSNRRIVIQLELRIWARDSNRMKHGLPIIGVLLATLGTAGMRAGEAPLVSRLDAIHLAEIHTGRPSVSVSLLATEEGGQYAVNLDDGQRAAVDAGNGRLLALGNQNNSMHYEWPGIRVVAHRGGVSLGPPENTLPAIARAIEIGADLIEVDIRETSDGHLVLMHDRTVDRTTNGHGSVADMTLSAVLELRIDHSGGGPIRVPTLSEALRLMKGRIDADLDFKEGDLSKLISAVREQGMEDHVTMHASWERCRLLSRLEPRIRIRPTVEHSGQVRDLVNRLHPAMVNFDWHSVTETAVRTAHLAGCLAFVNCLGAADTDFYVREAIRIGADYIQSDRPDRVLEILRDSGERSTGPILGSQLGTPLQHQRLSYPLR